MDDEEDDFYDPVDAVPPPQQPLHAQNEAGGQPQDNNHMDEDVVEEEEEEEDDDDFNIITEAPADGAPLEASHPRHATLRQESQRPPSVDSSGAARSATPAATPRYDTATPVPGQPAVPKPPSEKPGSAYPAIHSSTIDVNANPVHPMTGKPIMSTDMDADFPSDDKPWRRPGSDLSDYFNYGFDEFTWAGYCIKQQGLRQEVSAQKRQMDDMQAFMGMGMPPMPGAPVPPTPPSAAPPMAGMPGMPDMNSDMMQGMLATMMSQGLDPSAMDPMAFMQHAQSMMPGGGQQGQPGFGGQPQGQGFNQNGQSQMGYGGYDQRGGGYGGRGRGRRW
ncbi:Pre-mRNA polyadenylation factor fip1 [Penicillium sp. DV-2018c]|nr:Pre-mRNA polyadenylation factor fip1 [Penicillium sp. DV-2018c]KAJ5560838.1 Pre-mRNA polyadenylation factor fip1 [Penicillium sp. DV-2018c]